MRVDPAVAFWRRVVKGDSGSCWSWAGPHTKTGYGKNNYSRNGRFVHYMAHRMAWQLTNGPIPAGLEIDHLCRNRGCVNPAHLELVTRDENARRAGVFQRGVLRKATCKHGHALTGSNRDSRNRCRACHRDRQRRRQAAIARI
jgi:hypothetical protein